MPLLPPIVRSQVQPSYIENYCDLKLVDKNMKNKKKLGIFN